MVVDKGEDADIPTIFPTVTEWVPETPTTVVGLETVNDGVPEIPTVVTGLLIVTFGIDDTPTVVTGFRTETEPDIGCIPE